MDPFAPILRCLRDFVCCRPCPTLCEVFLLVPLPRNRHNVVRASILRPCCLASFCSNSCIKRSELQDFVSSKMVARSTCDEMNTISFGGDEAQVTGAVNHMTHLRTQKRYFCPLPDSLGPSHGARIMRKEARTRLRRLPQAPLGSGGCRKDSYHVKRP
jgi:hypothetical protein